MGILSYKTFTSNLYSHNHRSPVRSPLGTDEPSKGYSRPEPSQCVRGPGLGAVSVAVPVGCSGIACVSDDDGSYLAGGSGGSSMTDDLRVGPPPPTPDTTGLWGTTQGPK